MADDLYGQKKPGLINSHKQMAMDGISQMSSMRGNAYSHAASTPLPDAARAHKGRDAKSKASDAADVDHGKV